MISGERRDGIDLNPIKLVGTNLSQVHGLKIINGTNLSHPTRQPNMGMGLKLSRFPSHPMCQTGPVSLHHSNTITSITLT